MRILTQLQSLYTQNTNYEGKKSNGQRISLKDVIKMTITSNEAI